MHTLTLNIDDAIYDKFMGLIDILPRESIVIEEADSIPYYPAISFEEAREKVARGIREIDEQRGEELHRVFDEILER